MCFEGGVGGWSWGLGERGGGDWGVLGDGGNGWLGEGVLDGVWEVWEWVGGLVLVFGSCCKGFLGCYGWDDFGCDVLVLI